MVIRFNPPKVHDLVYLRQSSYTTYLVQGILSTTIRIQQQLSIYRKHRRRVKSELQFGSVTSQYPVLT